MGTQKKNLEDRLVVISSDSPPSRKMADDIYEGLALDHTMGQSAIQLESRRNAFGNGEQTFHLVDPKGMLSMDDITYMIRNSNTFFVSKLENPLLQRPLFYLMDNMVSDLGERYAEISRSIDNGDAKKELNERFASYVAGYIPSVLKNVVKKTVFEEKLIPIANDITNIIRNYDDELLDVFKKNDNTYVENEEKLISLKEHLAGYLLLSGIVEKTTKQAFIDEAKCVSKYIGQQILDDDKYKGQFNWIMPFIDGRSDHNKKTPNEIVRIDDLPDVARDSKVRSVQLIRSHSNALLKAFDERKIKYNNLTQTNEYISLLNQEHASFEDFYILSPDKGGVADAMVFAREMHRRSGGKFSGRVVVFDKSRGAAEHIEGMDFSAAYVYKPEFEKEDSNVVVGGKMMPYDKVFADTFKDPESSDYIGKLFDVEFDSESEKSLIDKIKGHYAVLRDDIIGTAGTVDRSARRANRIYESEIYGLVEHPSYTANAIKKLGKLHSDGIVKAVYVSSSIVHPFPETRPWEVVRSMKDRFTKLTRDNFFTWLENENPAEYERLNQRTPKDQKDI